MPRVKVTGAGIYGAKGAIPIGTEFSFKGDVPAGWAGRVQVVGEDASEDADLVVNTDDLTEEDIDEMNKSEIMAHLDVLNVHYTKSTVVDELRDLLKEHALEEQE